MTKHNIQVLKPITMTLGCTSLVLAGLTIGIIRGMNQIISLASNDIQIPSAFMGMLLLGFVGFLLLGVLFY